MADDKPDVWVLTLQPLPADTPPEIRMRHVLKRLLRDYKIRCIRVAGGDVVAPDRPAAGQPDASESVAPTGE